MVSLELPLLEKFFVVAMKMSCCAQRAQNIECQDQRHGSRNNVQILARKWRPNGPRLFLERCVAKYEQNLLV
jgi:hypothetical protein